MIQSFLPVNDSCNRPNYIQVCALGLGIHTGLQTLSCPVLDHPVLLFDQKRLIYLWFSSIDTVCIVLSEPE